MKMHSHHTHAVLRSHRQNCADVAMHRPGSVEVVVEQLVDCDVDAGCGNVPHQEDRVAAVQASHPVLPIQPTQRLPRPAEILRRTASY